MSVPFINEKAAAFLFMKAGSATSVFSGAEVIFKKITIPATAKINSNAAITFKFSLCSAERFTERSFVGEILHWIFESDPT